MKRRETPRKPPATRAGRKPKAVPKAAPKAGRKPKTTPKGAPNKAGRKPKTTPKGAPNKAGRKPKTTPKVVPKAGRKPTAAPKAAPRAGRKPTAAPKAAPRALVPMADVRPPTEADLARYAARVHLPVLDFWRVHGWGRFDDGFLLLTEPAELQELLDEWLGGSDARRTPLGRTALGDLVYFRDLRDKARALGLPPSEAERACDVSLVDVRYKQVRVLALSFAEFAAGIVDARWQRENLGRALFDAALPRLGAPECDEVYGFFPAVALGGSEEPASLLRVKAREHLALLLQL